MPVARAAACAAASMPRARPETTTKPGGAEIGREPRRHPAAERRGVARPDERDGGPRGEPRVAERPEHRRRVGNRGEKRRIVGRAEQQQPRTGGLAGLRLRPSQLARDAGA